MVEIKGDSHFIAVNTNTIWDSNMNDYAGGNKLEVSVSGCPELIRMQSTLQTLENRLYILEAREAEEKRLRDENPGLKDMHNKYKIVYELVKTADNSAGS